MATSFCARASSTPLELASRNDCRLSLAPMLILALDTSMAACSACVYNAGTDKILASQVAFMDRGQAEALAPMVHEVMQASGIAYSTLSRVVVTIGPGTFTGVRIGLSFARGLGVALSIPVVGINSLAAIACNETSGAHAIIVASDARGDDIYFATFDAGGRELTPPAIVRLEDIHDMLPAQTCHILGSGTDAVLTRATHIRSTAGDLPIAANFMVYAAKLHPTDAAPEPLYLRPPDVKLPMQFNAVGVEAAALLSELHADSFSTAWTETSFRELLSGSGTTALVATNQNNPTGFVLFRSAADEAEILTICTRPDFRRKGLGRLLVRHMEQQLKTSGTKSLFIEVAVSNVAALALYQACGFASAGTRKNYYALAGGGHEDAIIMRKAL
jgi:tRNA threonylcarbamoyl adenosine modification protein YeaZ/ribosomal-protein-alanine acetyltransferase